MGQLSRIDKADDEFYKQSDLILKFCKNASKIFMEATPLEKRTICEIIGSNFTANAQKIDITLYPIFYDIIEMNRLGHSKNARFELTETQSGQQKRASKKALDLNGGADASRFELLVVSYMKHLLTPNAYKICNLIEKLGLVV